MYIMSFGSQFSSFFKEDVLCWAQKILFIYLLDTLIFDAT